MDWFFLFFIILSSASTNQLERYYLPPPDLQIGVSLEDINITLPRKVYSTTLSPDILEAIKSDENVSEIQTDTAEDIKSEFEQNKNALKPITFENYRQATSNPFHQEYETTTDYFSYIHSNTFDSLKQSNNQFQEPSQQNNFQPTYSPDIIEYTNYSQENYFDTATEIIAQKLPFPTVNSENNVFVKNDLLVSDHSTVSQVYDQNTVTELPQLNVTQMSKQIEHVFQITRGHAKKPYDYSIYDKQSVNKTAVYKNESVPVITDKSKDIYPAKKNRPLSRTNTDAAITDLHNIITSGKYSYSFSTSNGIHAEQNGTALGGVKAIGGYSYTGDDGKLYSVIYTADENGFQPRGSHLPTAPPIPEAILRVIEQSKRAEELGIYDNGNYDDQKYGYKNYETSGNKKNSQNDSEDINGILINTKYNNNVNNFKDYDTVSVSLAKEGEIILEDIDHSVASETLSNILTTKKMNPTVINTVNSNLHKFKTKSQKAVLNPGYSSENYDTKDNKGYQSTTITFRPKYDDRISQKQGLNNKLDKFFFSQNIAGDSLSLQEDVRNTNIEEALKISNNRTKVPSLQDLISAQFKNVSLRKKVKGDINVESNFTYHITPATTPYYTVNSSGGSSSSKNNLYSNQKRFQNLHNKLKHSNSQKVTVSPNNSYGKKNTVAQSVNNTRIFPSFVVSSGTLGIVTPQNFLLNTASKPTNLKNKQFKPQGAFAINNNKGRFTVKSDQSQLQSNIVTTKTTKNPVLPNQSYFTSRRDQLNYSVRGKIQGPDETNEDTLSEIVETTPVISTKLSHISTSYTPFNTLPESSSSPFYTTTVHPISSNFKSLDHYSGKEADVNPEFESVKDKLKVQKNIKFLEQNTKELPNNKALSEDFSGPKRLQGYNSRSGYYYK